MPLPSTCSLRAVSVPAAEPSSSAALLPTGSRLTSVTFGEDSQVEHTRCRSSVVTRSMASCHSEDRFKLRAPNQSAPISEATPAAELLRRRRLTRVCLQTLFKSSVKSSCARFRSSWSTRSRTLSRWARSTSMLMVNAPSSVSDWLECTSMLYTSPRRSWNFS